jgi:plasmid maintenance system killer protein
MGTIREKTLFVAVSEDQYSIRINDQWRICFEWRESDVYNAEIIDYH